MGVKVRFWKGAWWVFVNHQGKRKAKRIGDRATALKVARAIRERIAAGELQLGASSDETLETYGSAWLKGLTGNLKASTIAFYSENLRRHVLPSLGDRPIGAIVRADCRELVAGLRAKGLKLNTVRGIARTLSALLFARLASRKRSSGRIRIHDLRHTYSTLLLQAGAPITYVSQQLGHRDASITLRVYAHWLPDASRRESDRLDALQPSAPPAQPEVVLDDQVIHVKSFGMNGEPHFRELEPDARMAQSTRATPSRRLTVTNSACEPVRLPGVDREAASTMLLNCCLYKTLILEASLVHASAENAARPCW